MAHPSSPSSGTDRSVSKSLPVVPSKRQQYICYGGWVKSIGDGEMHYIAASKMPSLYGVPREDCVMYINSDADLLKLRGYREDWFKDKIKLQPISNGNYAEKLAQATLELSQRLSKTDSQTEGNQNAIKPPEGEKE